jgi:hypothetical protein
MVDGIGGNAADLHHHWYCRSAGGVERQRYVHLVKSDEAWSEPGKKDRARHATDRDRRLGLSSD